jgi:alkylation response protein AidB-like acyl-CoA dehydrogenase
MENDPYVDILPEDMPELPEITDEEAAEMADQWEPSDDDGMTDAEADADTLRMAGMGTDEDYGGMIGGDSDLLGEF